MSWQCADTVTRTTQPLEMGSVETDREELMWNLADRVVKAVSDMTVGTVIVLVHVALADRKRQQQSRKRLAN